MVFAWGDYLFLLMIFKYISLLLISFLMGNSSGPPSGYANNAPTFQNCTVCHSGAVNSGNGSIQFVGLPSFYVPGETYPIEIFVNGSNVRGFGFQAAVMKDDFSAGSFSINSTSNYSEINGDYIQQSSRNPEGSWVFDWIAPSSDIGEIIFSASGLATGGSSSISGDDVYTTEVSIPAQPLSIHTNLESTIFMLHNNYPNPFNPFTTIDYELKEQSFVELNIYDLSGNSIIRLVNEIQYPGYKTLQWNGNNNMGMSVPSGTYIYSISSKGKTQNKKMTLIK